MRLYSIFAAIVALGVLAAPITLTSCRKSEPSKLVILHTNDTHSQILPGTDDLGGVMRRKAIIDSVRKAEKNVMLVDAGDAVQGTLFFYLYGGRVEQEVMNILGVDERILGNHEFDNGIDSLASVLKLSDAEKLATNYDLSETPLDGMFKPYSIKEFDGKKIGFIGLNLDPEGIITKGNYEGLEFAPIVATANLMAEKLKKEEGVDAVIAISHIGYNPSPLVGDSVLAVNSRDIDVIIGGHSHDTIDPSTETGVRRSRLKNLEGKDVLVVQTGKAGRNLGKIEIDLNELGKDFPKYELIKVDSRYDGYYDEELGNCIAKYSAGVDSLMHLWIGTSERGLSNSSTELLNWFSDYVYERGSELAPGVDLAIVNKGGLRSGIPAGEFSKGHILNMLPFRNYITVIDVDGDDLKEVFDVMAKTDGNGVSKNVSVTYSSDGNRASNKAEEVLINGKPIDEDKTYRIATIDYLAKGGDYMKALTEGDKVADSPNVVYDDIISYFTVGKGKNKKLSGSGEARWTKK